LREVEFNEEEAALLLYKRESSIVQQVGGERRVDAVMLVLSELTIDPIQEMLQRLHALSTAQNQCLDEYRSLLPPVM
jgi:hypothetical protein